MLINRKIVSTNPSKLSTKYLSHLYSSLLWFFTLTLILPVVAFSQPNKIGVHGLYINDPIEKIEVAFGTAMLKTEENFVYSKRCYNNKLSNLSLVKATNGKVTSILFAFEFSDPKEGYDDYLYWSNYLVDEYGNDFIDDHVEKSKNKYESIPGLRLREIESGENSYKRTWTFDDIKVIHHFRIGLDSGNKWINSIELQNYKDHKK